jgi:Tol biopolymer transport system component
LRARTLLAAASGIAIALTAGGPAGADEAQTTTRITVGHNGSQANGDSNAPSMSDDGRWLVFSSNATNLVPDDTNDLLDLFLHDRTTGDTRLITRSADGAQADAGAYGARISADGSFVTFYSAATTLVPGDTDEKDNVFVWERESGEITRLPGADAFWPDISVDGRYVTYTTYASLVTADTDIFTDVYVYDRTADEASLITKTLAGGPAGGVGSTISDDGRYVALESDSTELIEEYVSGSNVFLHDRETGANTLVSRTLSGTGSAQANFAEISGDGRYVVFGSTESDLVSDDANAQRDIFLWERESREITAVSVTPDGSTGAGFSAGGRPSADGRYVVFWSTAMDLAGTAASGWGTQTYLFDRTTGRNRLVAPPVEAGGNGGGEGADVSADGRVIGFMSLSEELVADDSNDARDVFVTVLS